MTKKTPTFLLEKKNIIKFLLFVFVFAIIFVFVYNPLGGTRIWQELIGKESPLLYMSIIIAIGFSMLVISRITLYYIQKKTTISYLFYVFWMIFEIGIITCVCTLVAWLINEQHTYFYKILPRTFYYTISILLIPYVIHWLYFSLKENEKLMEKITEITSDNEDIVTPKDIINLKDEKGNLRLSVKLDHLYYMESANNYIYVYYEDSKKNLTKCTIRSSLKIIEESFLGVGLIRCHRSYMINFKKVKVLRKEKDGLIIELDYEGLPNIPVSKTYVDEIVSIFSKHSASN